MLLSLCVHQFQTIQLLWMEDQIYHSFQGYLTYCSYTHSTIYKNIYVICLLIMHSLLAWHMHKVFKPINTFKGSNKKMSWNKYAMAYKWIIKIQICRGRVKKIQFKQPLEPYMLQIKRWRKVPLFAWVAHIKEWRGKREATHNNRRIWMCLCACAAPH